MKQVFITSFRDIHAQIFVLYCIVHMVFVFGKWKFISSALSENGNPSSLRLSGFMVINIICLCEIWHTIRTEKFDTTHLLYLIGFALLLYSVVKFSQIIDLRNGKSTTPPKETEKEETTDGH